MRQWRIGEEQDGLRLDQALAKFLPDLGLRGRRRLLAEAGVLVNGRPGLAAKRVKTGDLVELSLPESLNTEAPPSAQLLAWQEPYCFFYKPPALHTAAIAGKNTPSLEAALERLLENKSPSRDIRLLQRLDFGTSGIVAAALNADAESAYRQWEREGRIRKYYLAFLDGILKEPVEVDWALDTDKRKKSRVLARHSAKKTFFTPLCGWPNGSEAPFPAFPAGDKPFTLAACRLASGQRHQIRAHAASLGHPLRGDSLYGEGKGDFILQHFALDFPGCSIRLKEPLFLKDKLPPTAQKAIDGWLEQNDL